jgi:RNA polymerase sigma-70 factor (ECF subfamily)
MTHVSNSEGVPDPEREVSGSGRRTGAAEERNLVRRAQAGDAAAYQELVVNHQRRVFGVIARILRRREDIEDIAQQVFVKAYFSLKRFDLRSTFSTWLYKITVNECWDYLRKKRARPLVYEGDLSEEQARRLEAFAHAPGAPADPRQRVELVDLLERLLDELDEQDRAMMLLKEVEGLSVEEISEVLHLNPNTVKVRLFRARGRLVGIYRQRLRDRPRPSPGRNR